MSTIREQLKTTFLGLAGLLSKMNVMQGEAESSKQEILGAISNIPEPDLSEVAKQGNDSGATNTAIYIGTNDIKDILNSGKILVEITSSEIDDMIDRIIGDDIQ